MEVLFRDGVWYLEDEQGRVLASGDLSWVESEHERLFAKELYS
jgi:hypothetical protein